MRFPLAARIGFVVAAVIGAAVGTGQTQQQSYPARSITLVVPFGAGGAVDTVGRTYARMLEKELGVAITVVNQPGAAGSLGINNVVLAKPDGYTIGISETLIFGLSPLVNPDLKFKTPNDYALIGGMTGNAGGMIAVQKDAPWKTWEEMVAAAKANPGKISIATPGIFNSEDVGIRHWQHENGGVFNLVPFSGGGNEAMNALLSGQTDATMNSPITMRGHLEAGRLRGLVYFSDERWGKVIKAFADIPSIRKFGSQASTEGRHIVMAPKDTPEPILAVIRAAHIKVARSPEYQKFAESVSAVPIPLDDKQALNEVEKFITYYKWVFANVNMGQKK